MTNEAKENLLKILLNEQNEQPGTNIGTLIDDGTKVIDVDSTTIYDRVSYNNYTIIIDYYNRLVLFDNEYNILFRDYLYINNTQTYLKTIDIDSEGNLYGLTYYNSNLNLVYMNNITQKNANGEYLLELKQNYNLEGMLTEIGNAEGTYVSRIGFHLRKNPTESSFVIILDGCTDETVNKNLTVIQYHVNFGGDNTYEYKIKNLGPYAEVKTQSIYINWEDASFRVNFFVINSAHNGYTYITPGAVKFYWVWTDFNEGTGVNQSLIYENNAFLRTGALSSSVLMGSDRIWFIDASKNTSTQAVTMTVFLNKNNAVMNKYSISGVEVGFSSMVYINNQMFIGLMAKLDATNYKTVLFQVQGENLIQLKEYEHSDYYLNLMLITNDFNLYNIIYDTHRYKYIYGTGYNGTEYFSDKSVTSESTTLYGINKDGSRNTIPIFSRDLYNKTVAGNSISSVVQVPYTYLNNSIITREQLISEDDNIIDDDYKEIEKNQYEEVYINHIDSFKVFNNNNGSSYNQNSSLELVQNIYSGFEQNYKITNYRINYNNGMYLDRPINHIERDGNVGKLTIYINTENVKNVELYDSGYRVSFLTIDVPYNTGLYKIEQYVKVE